MDPISSLATTDPRPARAYVLAERFRATLDTAQALMRSRRAVDLDGLNDLAGQLCAACLDLPNTHRSAMTATLAALLDRLDLLEATVPPAP
jgi:hypothetical protein